MKPKTLLSTLAIGLVATTGPLAGQHFPDDEGLLEIIRTRVDEGRATGIVLGVLEADGSRRVVAYGDPGPDARPLGAESVFEIGSISKVFTGILLAEMSARGEVSLEAPVQAYAHDGVTIPSRNGRQITLLDLTTHRSSLPRLPGNMAPSDPTNPYADYTDEQMHDFLSAHELRRDIGSEYEYSNLAAGLLGHVLAARAGTDYETLVRDRILEPLGMDMSGITLSGEMEAWLAKGHFPTGDVATNWDLPTLAGAGALRSNANDMLTFLEANIGEPTTELERAMRVSHDARQPAGGVMDVGLGWHIRKVGDDRIVWHNGGTGGYRTFAGFDPDREVGVVVLTNSTEGADDIGFHLLNEELEPAPAPTPPAERVVVEVAPEILERYAGEYELRADFTVTVTFDERGLRMQPTGQPRFPMFAESETEFFLRAAPVDITFIVEDGEVTGLDLVQGGQTQRARKIR